MFSIFLGIGLFCNVVNLGMHLIITDAGWIQYVSLLGSVVFGMHIMERNND